MAPSNGLAALGGWFEALPFESLLIGHCLQISSMIQPMREKYLLSYWVRLIVHHEDHLHWKSWGLR